MPQLAGAYEHERREAQGTANRQRSFVTVDRAHQRAHPLRIGYGGKVRRSYRGQGAAQIARGIAFGAAGGDGVAEHLAAIAERAVRGSGAVKSAIGRAPIQGNMSRSNRVSIRSP